MICLDDAQIEFCNMGFFDGEKGWMHPAVKVPTYELILVTNGEVFLYENGVEYHLKKGDLLLLEKNVLHGGSKKSKTNTSFFWLHFNCVNVAKLFPKKFFHFDFPLAERRMKQIMHYSFTSTALAETELLKLALELQLETQSKNGVAYEIAEYVRINGKKALTVQSVANRYGYTPDHLSRIIKKEFGVDAKTLIVKSRLEFIESELINTDYSIEEIALSTGFENENAFVKFFKYHTKSTPTAFRRRTYFIHMNNK